MRRFKILLCGLLAGPAQADDRIRIFSADELTRAAERAPAHDHTEHLLHRIRAALIVAFSNGEPVLLPQKVEAWPRWSALPRVPSPSSVSPRRSPDDSTAAHPPPAPVSRRWAENLVQSMPDGVALSAQGFRDPWTGLAWSHSSVHAPALTLDPNGVDDARNRLAAQLSRAAADLGWFRGGTVSEEAHTAIAEVDSILDSPEGRSRIDRAHRAVIFGLIDVIRQDVEGIDHVLAAVNAFQTAHSYYEDNPAPRNRRLVEDAAAIALDRCGLAAVSQKIDRVRSGSSVEPFGFKFEPREFDPELLSQLRSFAVFTDPGGPPEGSESSPDSRSVRWPVAVVPVRTSTQIELRSFNALSSWRLTESSRMISTTEDDGSLLSFRPQEVALDRGLLGKEHAEAAEAIEVDHLLARVPYTVRVDGRGAVTNLMDPITMNADVRRHLGEARARMMSELEAHPLQDRALEIFEEHTDPDAVHDAFARSAESRFQLMSSLWHDPALSPGDTIEAVVAGPHPRNAGTIPYTVHATVEHSEPCPHASNTCLSILGTMSPRLTPFDHHIATWLDIPEEPRAEQPHHPIFHGSAEFALLLDEEGRFPHTFRLVQTTASAEPVGDVGWSRSHTVTSLTKWDWRAAEPRDVRHPINFHEAHVTITGAEGEDLLVDAYETTRRQWMQVLGVPIWKTPQERACPRWADELATVPQDMDLPMGCVSFFDAVVYANTRSARDGPPAGLRPRRRGGALGHPLHRMALAHQARTRRVRSNTVPPPDARRLRRRQRAAQERPSQPPPSFAMPRWARRVHGRWDDSIPTPTVCSTSPETQRNGCGQPRRAPPAMKSGFKSGMPSPSVGTAPRHRAASSTNPRTGTTASGMWACAWCATCRPNARVQTPPPPDSDQTPTAHRRPSTTVSNLRTCAFPIEHVVDHPSPLRIAPPIERAAGVRHRGIPSISHGIQDGVK